LEQEPVREVVIALGNIELEFRTIGQNAFDRILRAFGQFQLFDRGLFLILFNQ